MLVDAHAHVWRAVPNYPEPAATTVSPVSDVPVEILDEYLTEYGVDRAVLVQPVYPGEDNGYVYGELLGMSSGEIKSLADEGVI